MQQTQVTDNNLIEFYAKVYPVVNMDKSMLIDLNNFHGNKIIFDSAGWHYQKHFKDQTIIKIEDLSVIKQFKLNNTQFDKIFKNTDIPKINDPSSALILDHAAILKYKSVQEINHFLNSLTSAITSDLLIIRAPLITMGDFRFNDRIKNLVDIIPKKFITLKLNYDVITFSMHLKRIREYDFN